MTALFKSQLLMSLSHWLFSHLDGLPLKTVLYEAEAMANQRPSRPLILSGSRGHIAI